MHSFITRHRLKLCPVPLLRDVILVDSPGAMCREQMDRQKEEEREKGEKLCVDTVVRASEFG
jgi:hypothetical protein